MDEFEKLKELASASSGRGSEEVIMLEVCDPGRFDNEAYRRKFSDMFGANVRFAMDSAPRFNEQDGFWFVEARAE